MLTQLHITGKSRDKLDKKMGPMIEKRAKVRAEYEDRVDAYVKQNPGTTTLPAGLVQNLIDKLNEWDQKLGPLERERRVEDSTYRMLLASIGDLISSLDEADQIEQTNYLISQYERVRKVEDKSVYLDILGHVHNKQAALGLVGITANDDEPALRVAALDALERLGDPNGAKAAQYALEDEHWPVRAAALEAAIRFASIDMIELLIGRLDKEDGRLKGDLIEALGLLTGVSYADNAPLWKKWWEENKEKLVELMADVEAESDGQRALGLGKMEARGFLLAAQRYLDQAGLSASALRRAEAKRLVNPEIKLEEREVEKLPEEPDDLLLAVGRTIGTCAESVRERAFEEFVLRPFGITKEKASRLKLIELMGHVGTEEAAEILASMMRKRDSNDLSNFERIQKERLRQGRLPANWRWNADERFAAVRALGFCAGEKQIDLLVGLFRDLETDRDTLLHAARALASVDSSKGVRALINALSEIESMEESRRTEMVGVQKLLGDSLRKVTGLTHGDEAEAWLAWWNTDGSDFKTEAEKQLEEDPAAAAADKNVGTRFYGIRTYSKRIVFVLDISGSMNEPTDTGETETKIEVAKKELTQAIASLPADALFDIIFYSTGVEVWQKNLVEADAKAKKAAKTYVAEKEAGGGTNIHEPLLRAFDLAGRGSRDKEYGEVAVDTIFFLSDGQPTAGRITDPEDILREVQAANKLRKVQIHTVGVGRGHHAVFMRVLAESSGGQYIAR